MCVLCKPFTAAEALRIENGRRAAYDSDRGDMLLEVLVLLEGSGGIALLEKWLHWMLDRHLRLTELPRWGERVSSVAIAPFAIRMMATKTPPWRWSDSELLDVIFATISALRGASSEDAAAEMAISAINVAAVFAARRMGDSGEDAWKGPLKDLAIALRAEHPYESIRDRDDAHAIADGLITRRELDAAYAGARMAVN